MADVYCKRCGEPWEFLYVQHDMTEEERERFWSGEGCPACYGKPAPEKKPFRAQLASAFHDVLGDDLDGLAAEMEDAEYLLGKEFWE